MEKKLIRKKNLDNAKILRDLIGIIFSKYDITCKDYKIYNYMNNDFENFYISFFLDRDFNIEAQKEINSFSIINLNSGCQRNGENNGYAKLDVYAKSTDISSNVEDLINYMSSSKAVNKYKL